MSGDRSSKVTWRPVRRCWERRNQTGRIGSVRRPERQLRDARRRKMLWAWPGREIRGELRVRGSRSWTGRWREAVGETRGCMWSQRRRELRRLEGRVLWGLCMRLPGSRAGDSRVTVSRGETRTVEEEMHRWREHFERVLYHEEPPNLPEVEPGNELNIGTGCIIRVEIKNAIKKLKSGKPASCDNIPPGGNQGWRWHARGGSFRSL